MMVLRVVLAVALALVLVALAGGFTLPLGAVELRMGVIPLAGGVTEINLPPFGQISASTHAVPLKVVITWENVDLRLLSRLIENVATQDDLVAVLLPRLRVALGVAAGKILLVAALGGGLAAVIWRARRARDYLYGALAGVLVMASLLAGTAVTYRADAFAHPRYQGLLEMAPSIVGMAQDVLADVATFNERLQLTGKNISELFHQLDQVRPPATKDMVKILHVSDIHNNPAAYRLIEAIATSFQVDAIIDTGDISDLGTPLEARLSQGIAALPFPYLFIPGNHETPEIIASLAALPNVQILDGQVADIKGVRIFGQADPAAARASLEPPTAAERKKMVAALQDSLAGIPKKPQVIAVHNNQVGRELAGLAPVILSGHDHRLALTEVTGSWLIDAGTTGAAGIRGLSTDQEVPYTLVILYFGPGQEDLELKLADVVEVSPLTGGFTLERRVINP